MVALIEGTKAPDFELQSLEGSQYSLKKALSKSDYVVLAFFKVSCPVCQLTLPYIERLHKAHPETPVWGISQDDPQATKEFAQQYGLTFPLLLDESLSSTVAYDLTNVPTIFLVGRDGQIQQTIVGFSKQDLENLNSRIAETGTHKAGQLFLKSDDVPDFRPG